MKFEGTAIVDHLAGIQLGYSARPSTEARLTTLSCSSSRVEASHSSHMRQNCRRPEAVDLHHGKGDENYPPLRNNPTSSNCYELAQSPAGDPKPVRTRRSKPKQLGSNAEKERAKAMWSVSPPPSPHANSASSWDNLTLLGAPRTPPAQHSTKNFLLSPPAPLRLQPDGNTTTPLTAPTPNLLFPVFGASVLPRSRGSPPRLQLKMRRLPNGYRSPLRKRARRVSEDIICSLKF